MRAPDGYSVEREGAHAVALDLAIDADLRDEGRAREIVHAVQNARKNAGLAVDDRIALGLEGGHDILRAARVHEAYIARETLALAVIVGGRLAPEVSPIHAETLDIERIALTITLGRCL